MNGTSAELYHKLEVDRRPFLERARDCARLTIPSLIPPEGHNKTTRLPTPYQSVGARGLNNISAKLLLALLPPNSPFFRLRVDDQTVAELAGDEALRTEVEEALNKVERSVVNEMETTGLRSPIFESLKHLVCAGNVLLHLPKGRGARVFPLSQYVVRRDPEGNLLLIIVKEEVSPLTLPEDVRALLPEQRDKDEPVELYTRMELQDGKYVVYQEIADQEIEGSRGTYPLDKAPFIALRWTRIDGEDYGRGYIEEYLGDLNSLDGLSQAILDASVASAKVVFLLHPNATMTVRDLAEAESGDVIAGDAEEVDVLQVEKQADMSVAQSVAAEIQNRLAHAFLMNTAIQRPGERVTAEEIRFMAGELEDALGGVYSILSQEFQLPLVSRIMARMEAQGRIPKLPKQAVRPSIVTGLEALGRGHDLQRLQVFIQAITSLGEEALARVDMGSAVKRIGTSLGIDMSGLVKTEEQVQAEQRQKMQAMLAQQMGDGASKAIPQVAKAAMDAAGQQPQETA